MRSQANPTPWATLFFALLGLIWCGYIAFPTGNPAPCATSGCALFRDYKLAGVSLWWIGGAYFFLLAVLCLRGNRHAARILAMLALFADALLLLLMFFTAPCFDCLVVAVIIALCYYSLQKPAPDVWFTDMGVRPSLLLPVWLGLFLGNAVLAANEQMPLYTLGNTRTSEVRIYFSPSCKACREAVSSLGNAATLYPVLESEQDFDSIIRLSALLKVNVPVQEAILHSINENGPVPVLAFYERAILRLQLLRNKAHLLRQGFRAVPLVQINGWPGEKASSLENATPPPPDTISAPVSPALPQEQTPPDTPTLLPEASSAPHEGRGFAMPDHLQPTDNSSLLELLGDPDALEQCGGNRDEPCD
jgi:hypothetical protein